MFPYLNISIIQTYVILLWFKFVWMLLLWLSLLLNKIFSFDSCVGSSQMQTLQSYEHDANIFLNSRCTHLTFHIDFVCAIIHSYLYLLVLCIHIYVCISWIEVNTITIIFFGLLKQILPSLQLTYHGQQDQLFQYLLLSVYFLLLGISGDNLHSSNWFKLISL